MLISTNQLKCPKLHVDAIFRHPLNSSRHPSHLSRVILREGGAFSILSKPLDSRLRENDQKQVNKRIRIEQA